MTTVRRVLPLCGALALAMALSVNPAFAGLWVQGSTTGGFTTQSNPTPTSPVDGLSFNGANNFSANVDPSANVDLGTFSLDTGLFGYFDPYRFRLDIAFTSPADTDPNPVSQSAEVEGVVLWILGGVQIDFDNSPIQFTYGGGTSSFNLSISDVTIRNYQSNVSLRGTFQTGPTISTDEEPASWALLLSVMTGLGFALKRKAFVRA